MAGQELLNEAIQTGRQYPQRDPLDLAGFRAYFLSHDAFSVVRVDTQEVIATSPIYDWVITEIMPGCWRHVLQAQLPRHAPLGVSCLTMPSHHILLGRCSHICNGGFITKPAYRQQARRRCITSQQSRNTHVQGIGRWMGSRFLRLAKRIGFRAVFFNLAR